MWMAPYHASGGIDAVARTIAERLAARNVPDWLAPAKALPGELSCGSLGIGGLQRLNAGMCKPMADIDLVHVPNKGTAQLLPDLIAGRVPMAIDSVPAHLPHIRRGTLQLSCFPTPETAMTAPLACSWPSACAWGC